MPRTGRKLDEISELLAKMARHPGGATPAECGKRLGISGKAAGMRLARLAVRMGLFRGATKEGDAGYRYFGSLAEAEAPPVKAEPVTAPPQAPAAIAIQGSVLDTNDCRPWAKVVAP